MKMGKGFNMNMKKIIAISMILTSMLMGDEYEAKVQHCYENEDYLMKKVAILQDLGVFLPTSEVTSIYDIRSNLSKTNTFGGYGKILNNKEKIEECIINTEKYMNRYSFVDYDKTSVNDELILDRFEKNYIFHKIDNYEIKVYKTLKYEYLNGDVIFEKGLENNINFLKTKEIAIFKYLIKEKSNFTKKFIDKYGSDYEGCINWLIENSVSNGIKTTTDENYVIKQNEVFNDYFKKDGILSTYLNIDFNPTSLQIQKYQSYGYYTQLNQVRIGSMNTIKDYIYIDLIVNEKEYENTILEALNSISGFKNDTWVGNIMYENSNNEHKYMLKKDNYTFEELLSILHYYYSMTESLNYNYVKEVKVKNIYGMKYQDQYKNAKWTYYQIYNLHKPICVKTEKVKFIDSDVILDENCAVNIKEFEEIGDNCDVLKRNINKIGKLDVLKLKKCDINIYDLYKYGIIDDDTTDLDICDAYPEDISCKSLSNTNGLILTVPANKDSANLIRQLKNNNISTNNINKLYESLKTLKKVYDTNNLEDAFSNMFIADFEDLINNKYNNVKLKNFNK